MTVPAPDHPLARFRGGRPAASMHHLYFQGRYWARVHNGPLTIVFTPTAATIGEKADYHFKFFNLPRRGFIPNPDPHGRGYIKDPWPYIPAKV